MSRIVLASLALCFGLVFTPHEASVHAEAGMRCGTRLVHEGDPTYRVRQLCGDPVSVARRVEFRSIRVPIGVNPNGPGYSYANRTIEVQVDEWIYDFGPQKFVRRLVFEQDRLVRTFTDGYGVLVR
jgi:hypothetical protein